jgi:hypothetical protein
MNFSANIIEEWLLSGQAVLKNLSCGNAGLVQIPVPEGKTYIITKIEVLPFGNYITDSAFAHPATNEEVRAQDLQAINQRTQYQLLFWNERINNTWNIRNKFGINTILDASDNNSTAPNLTFEKEIIDCFMVVESDSYIFLKYIDFSTINPTITQTQLNSIFNIQWPPSPDFGYSDQYDIIQFVLSSSTGDPSYNYVPQGLETNFATPPESFNDTFVKPASPLSSGGNPVNTFIPPLNLVPGEVGGTLLSSALKSIPLYNIQYIEINRRLSTTGLL